MMFYPSREQQLSEQFGQAPTSLATFKETISDHIFSGIGHAINIAPFGHFLTHQPILQWTFSYNITSIS